MARDKKKILIFERGFAGHRAHYIDVLVEAIRVSKPCASYVFVLHHNVLRRLKPTTASFLASPPDNIQIRLLADGESRACSAKRGGILASIACWRLATHLAAEYDATEIIFLLLDDVIMAACVSSLTRFAISGIYFRPSMHYPEYRQGIVGKMRQLAKGGLFRRLLQRADICEIWSDDPYFARYSAENYRYGNKVKNLAEPFDAPAVEHSSVIGEKVRFILFGALQARKGISNLFTALHIVEADVLERAEFVICGDGDLADTIEATIPGLTARGIDVRFKRGFLPQAELDRELSNAHVILAPYQGHVGSSGVVYIAAAWRKPIIASKEGLIGRQIAEYGLGLAIDTTSASSLADAIGQTTAALLNSKATSIDDDGFRRFMMQSGTGMFADQILNLSRRPSVVGQ